MKEHLESEIKDGKIFQVDVATEMQRSYIDYAMSVIVERALPDVRDGLKPVQRRILYGMSELGNTPDKPHKKSARIVGEVMGKYHPHGDAAIYDAMVRMAQDFSFRGLLVDGHGNFGSVDGDPPAAMRYTEARLSRLAMEMLADINKETVDFRPNFDETLQEPTVLPSRFPNLLVNGSAGIAVGMATNIPPHNLGEVIDGLVHLIDEPEMEITELMRFIKGPDFPTAGLILGREGIRQAYTTGRGQIQVRARAQIEQMAGGKARIVVTEIPYMVNKAAMIERIAALVRDKKIEGIADLRDESDRSGLRVVIELKRDARPQVVLNQLYKHTQMQETFGVIMLALVDGSPRVLNLKEMLHYYLLHQREVITRRSQYDLRKAEERAHILEGLRIALDQLDAVISLIRASRTDEEAKAGLMRQFDLTERQAQAILEMRLRRLTGLEREKIEEEYREILKTIAYLKELLADIRKIDGVIKQELLSIKERFADPRRTEIVAEAETELAVEDLIADEDMVVTLTHAGYIKRLPLNTYKSQRRGGRGITGLSTKDGDFVEQLFITSTLSSIFFFSNKGKVYQLKGHELPEAGRQARGTAIVNLLPLEAGEQINAVIPVRQLKEGYLFMATAHGVVKKTPLEEFANIRHNGLIALNLGEGDELVGVRLTDGKQEVILVTAHGLAIRFAEEQVRPMGRSARGVKGIALEGEDRVIGMDKVKPEADLLVVTRHGYGKRTPLAEYRSQSRGGKGLKTLQLTRKNGPVVGIKVVKEENEVMLITAQGILIRMPIEEVSRQGRITQGVRMMRLEENDTLVALAQVVEKKEEDNGTLAADAPSHRSGQGDALARALERAEADLAQAEAEEGQ